MNNRLVRCFTAAAMAAIVLAAATTTGVTADQIEEPVDLALVEEEQQQEQQQQEQEQANNNGNNNNNNDEMITQDHSIVDDYFGPDETRGYFDIVMKPYPIPVRTTTYVDFVFNLPEDLPDLFHVTMGEVINSQPLHLHHFVLMGCNFRVDDDTEHAMPNDSDEMERGCNTPLGGWAPGANVFGNIDLDTGVLMGRKIGVEAIRLNVHYTDGAYADDESTQTLKMAQDGLRIHYTTDFRPYTSVSQSLIDVAFAPSSLTIPPGEERFFLTRTCKVNTSCKDVAPEDISDIIGFMGAGDAANAMFGNAGGDEDEEALEISCTDLLPLCFMGGQIGPMIQMFCPATCGFCDDDDTTTDADGNIVAKNHLNPDTYRITSVQYHAHLLGTEMYTTLLREEEQEVEVEQEEEPSLALQKQMDAAEDEEDEDDEKAAPTTKETVVTTKDLESREFWLYDFQETIPFPLDTIRGEELLRGTEIKVGDKIQATCVYNSSYRKEATRFSLSTYDEMCITTVHVTFATPDSLLNTNNSDNNDNDNDNSTFQLDLGMELRLMSFSCDIEEETDVYSGTLAVDEDARNIWKDHPISAVEGCTYPVPQFGLGIFSSRCPIGDDDNDNSQDFDGISDVADFDGAEEEESASEDEDEGVQQQQQHDKEVEVEVKPEDWGMPEVEERDPLPEDELRVPVSPLASSGGGRSSTVGGLSLLLLVGATTTAAAWLL